jgi:hypothetical protein
VPIYLFQIKEDGSLKEVKEYHEEELSTPNNQNEITVEAHDVREALLELVQTGVLPDMY